MALAIDSVVSGCYIYKDVWSAGIDSGLPCSPESTIAKTGMPLHMVQCIEKLTKYSRYASIISMKLTGTIHEVIKKYQ